MIESSAQSLSTLESCDAPNLALIQDISLDSITKSYPRSGMVLDHVSFEVFRGQSVALVGSNGSGKSTLMRVCIGLTPIDQGKVAILQNEIANAGRKGLRALRTRVGFVFQHHNLVPRVSVLSNVIHGALAQKSSFLYWGHSFAPRAVRERALSCLSRVGLADLAQRRADQLSGGQSQRVAIARALMQEPQILMADEPVASLDPAAGEEVMQLFADLCRSDGLTLLFSTHHIEHALKYSDRIIGLTRGRKIIDSETSLINESTLRGIYG